MERSIYIVNHTQVVTSQANPDGLYSNKPGYPKVYDSKDYGDRTFDVAEAEYRSCESTMLLDTNETRVMQTITMERSDGRFFFRRCKGAFPAPEPEPEPEEPAAGE